MSAKVSAQTYDGCRTGAQTVRLDVIEERHEAEIHVQLLVAMEEGEITQREIRRSVTATQT